MTLEQPHKTLYLFLDSSIACYHTLPRWKFKFPGFQRYVHNGRDNAIFTFNSDNGRLCCYMLFEPHHGRKSSSTKRCALEEPSIQKIDSIKLTAANPEEGVYSREHLREERMVSLHRLLAELESHLTCSRRTLSTQERKRYIDAVLCLRSVKPALYEHEVRGTSSRYNDFQAVRINQTFIIHSNVNLSTASKDQSIELIYSTGPISRMASMVHMDV